MYARPARQVMLTIKGSGYERHRRIYFNRDDKR
jgi:hypothetical protein